MSTLSHKVQQAIRLLRSIPNSEADPVEDTRPKNTWLQPIPKGKEYVHFIIDLAQGYELDWITWPYILINEYGESEHVDSFNKRHPNFTKDVRTASAIVSLLRAVFRSVITSHYQLSAK